jgi:tryptophan synthase alpha chain
MSAIDTLFAELRSTGRKAFMPFVTAGDPDLEFTSQLIRRLDALGCSLFELGIPYSDPVADGPVIQASFTRALDHKVKLADILAMTKNTTAQIKSPIVSMLSYAIVFRHGLERYVADAKAAGISGAIVPDLPVDEAAPLAEICRRQDFSRDRAIRIAEQTTGFIYYVSVTGITGERTELPPDIVDNVAWLRSQTPLPICIGFGISQPKHVRMLLPVADGLIVGSAIVRHLAEATQKPRKQILDEIDAYAAELLAAMEK